MASTVTSTYRDRTSEFRSVSLTLKKIGGVSDANGSQNGALPSKPSATSHKSEFNRKASQIGLRIHETSLKIVRLEKLAKRTSIFDDPTKEIQELTALIKDDITALNVAVSDLQTLQNMEIADGNYSEDNVVHSTTICDDLNNKLMRVTKQFKEVLTARTENIKAHENRKQIFSTNMARESPLRNAPRTVTEPPPWSTSSAPSGNLQQSMQPLGGVQAGNQLRRRLATENTSSHHTETSMLQQVVPQQESYSQSRAAALQNVESTISELGGIFTHLATMVAQQGELAIRIDDNMEETLANVDSARSALLRHLHQISSNRGLMIKIFAVLIFFLMLFLFVV
ncbi:hypothetical protein NMG60_11011919 [Bertholletia excelsa]